MGYKFDKNINNLVMSGIESSEYDWENGNELNANTYFYKSSNAKRSMQLQNATKWVFDFSDVLLFGDDVGIQELQYTLTMDVSSKNKFVQSAATINGRTVTIETDKPC